MKLSDAQIGTLRVLQRCTFKYRKTIASSILTGLYHIRTSTLDALERRNLVKCDNEHEYGITTAGVDFISEYDGIVDDDTELATLPAETTPALEPDAPLSVDIEFSPNIPEETPVPGDYVDLHTRSFGTDKRIWRASLAGAIFRVVEVCYEEDWNEIIIEWQDAQGNRILHAAGLECFQMAELVNDPNRLSPAQWAKLPARAPERASLIDALSDLYIMASEAPDTWSAAMFRTEIHIRVADVLMKIAPEALPDASEPTLLDLLLNPVAGESLED